MILCLAWVWYLYLIATALGMSQLPRRAVGGMLVSAALLGAVEVSPTRAGASYASLSSTYVVGNGDMVAFGVSTFRKHAPRFVRGETLEVVLGTGL